MATLRLRAGQAVSGCRVVPEPAERWSQERPGAPAQSRRGKTPAAPPWDARQRAGCRLESSVARYGRDAWHRTGRFQSGPAVRASSISDTASRRSGVLISLPCAQSQGSALSPCAAVSVSVNAPRDPRRPAAGHAHRPSSSRTHRLFAKP